MRQRSEEQIVHELLTRATRNEKGCLISHLRPNAKGYVNVGVGGREGGTTRGHRFIWAFFKGSIPHDKQVCHSCDTRNCLNIEHLFLGTPAENTADMMRKGRNKFIRPNTQKVTDEILEQMFELNSQGTPGNEIALILGLSPATISSYLRGERHVK